MTLTMPASAVDPRRDPDWYFRIHIPGRPRGKGSQIQKHLRIGGKTRVQLVEKDIVLDWIAQAAGYCLQERMRRQAHGDKSFPYEAPLMLRCDFVYDRPHTQPNGPPITKAGTYAVADLDKLLRSIGDALSPGEFTLRGEKIAKAGVILDDCLITRIEARKAFSDEVDGIPAGAYIRLNPV